MLAVDPLNSLRQTNQLRQLIAVNIVIAGEDMFNQILVTDFLRGYVLFHPDSQ